MIGKAEDEITEESSQRQQQNPIGPFSAIDGHHPVRDQKQSQAGISKRSRKRRSIRQTLQSVVIKEATVEMQNHARQTHRDREPPDQVSQIAPHGLITKALARDQGGKQNHRSNQRKVERDIFAAPTEFIRRMGEVDVERQKGKINDDENLDPKDWIAGPVLDIRITS